MTEPAPTPALEPLTCPECRYDLSGLPTGNCPECGKAFTPEQLREYWNSCNTQPPYWLDIALSVICVATMVCIPNGRHGHSFGGQWLLVPLLSAVIARIDYSRVRSNQCSLERMMLLLAPSAMLGAAMLASQSPVNQTFTMCLCNLGFAAVIIWAFRDLPQLPVARLAYPAALLPTFLLFLHPLYREDPMNTPTEFEFWKIGFLTGTGLLAASGLVLFLCTIGIIQLERLVRSARRTTSSSSAHSPAGAPAPPSQSEP